MDGNSSRNSTQGNDSLEGGWMGFIFAPVVFVLILFLMGMYWNFTNNRLFVDEGEDEVGHVESVD